MFLCWTFSAVTLLKVFDNDSRNICEITVCFFHSVKQSRKITVKVILLFIYLFTYFIYTIYLINLQFIFTLYKEGYFTLILQFCLAAVTASHLTIFYNCFYSVLKQSSAEMTFAFHICL